MDTNKYSKYNFKKFDPADYERPSITVDVLIFTIDHDLLKVVLIKRGIEPFKDHWALPGGFVKANESLEGAAIRELSEETGVKDVYLEQLYTFGELDRDPRGRVITVAYIALVPFHKLRFSASTDAKEVALFPITALPLLAFDHKRIINLALVRLRSKIQYSNIVFGLMPDKFRLSELQKVYEIILAEKLDKRNFRKKLFSLELLEKTGEKELEGAHRPAMLYKFKKKEPIFFD